MLRPLRRRVARAAATQERHLAALHGDLERTQRELGRYQARV